MELSKSLKSYLDDISSSSPTPGGGSVSAFAGALAGSLGIMVCNLTTGKKKYADVEEEIKKIKSELEKCREEFLDLAKKDNEAFDLVMAAFKLPKETDEQKKIRTDEIEKATYKAMITPADVIKACTKMLPLMEILSQKGNQNSVSDAGVGISLTKSAAHGAFLNVLINYSSLSDKNAAKELFDTSKELFDKINLSSGNILSSIVKNISK